ncbi:MAG: 50S ribosomal protein L29 [Flavobacteriales bacterium]|jgi:large subunit ribosomal protein L29|nr:50S ribosomal protein L29 [Flavobacteriales bacterium]|tara:strand:+ start:355 stop:552 length:198 start_codon:yes stop_codon:yes gene_type:complete
MKAQVLTDMPENELQDLLATEREKLIKMKMSHAVSPMENPLQIKFTRKAIARVMTELSKRRNTSK